MIGVHYGGTLFSFVIYLTVTQMKLVAYLKLNENIEQIFI